MHFTHNIIRYIVFLPMLALADETAGVYHTNYDLGVAYAHSTYTDNSYVSAKVNFPLYQYLGASLNANANANKANANENNVIDSHSYTIGGDLFLRNFNRGKIGTSASYSKIFLDLPSDLNLILSDNYENYNYSLYGQYYFNDFTFGVVQSWFDSKNNSSHSFGASLNWYWEKNTKLTLAANEGKILKNYALSLSHQPEFLNNSTEISLTFNKYENSNTFRLTLNYYFNTIVNLKDRDRKFR